MDLSGRHRPTGEILGKENWKCTKILNLTNSYYFNLQEGKMVYSPSVEGSLIILAVIGLILFIFFIMYITGGKKKPKSTKSVKRSTSTASKPGYCTECGKKIATNTNYCAHCGKKIKTWVKEIIRFASIVKYFS